MSIGTYNKHTYSIVLIDINDVKYDLIQLFL